MLYSWMTNLALYNILHNPQKDYSTVKQEQKIHEHYTKIMCVYILTTNYWILKLILKSHLQQQHT